MCTIEGVFLDFYKLISNSLKMHTCFTRNKLWNYECNCTNM